MIIYKIVNKLDNKIYIGQTINSLHQRWIHHCGGYSSCTYLRNAIQKHGKDNFIIEQIDSAETIDNLNDKEVYWINHYKSNDKQYGYNIREGGKNKRHSEESIQKMKISSTGKKHSEETKRKMSEQRKNMSEETRRKMSLSRMGKVQSTESIEKRAKKRRGSKFNEESRNKVRLSQRNRRIKQLESNPMMGIRKINEGKFRVETFRKYLGIRNTIEESMKLRDEYIKSLTTTESNTYTEQVENKGEHLE